MQAACPLEGGGLSEGSTCGVVSGGCLALALAHLGELLESDEGKVEALYRRMRDYTAWFEQSFGSTLCRDRCGADLRKASGFADYIFTGKVFTRCVNHIGKSVLKLIEMVNFPLEKKGDREGGEASAGMTAAPVAGGTGLPVGGLCAAPVLHHIREETGKGNRFLEDISIALDGGIGLSGGLCGALAGALLPLGEAWGIDPRSEGVFGTLRFFVRGHLNLYAGRGEKGLWAMGNPLARGFRRRFGSLECRELTGQAFAGRDDLEDYVRNSDVCREIRDWCVEETLRILR